MESNFYCPEYGIISKKERGRMHPQTVLPSGHIELRCSGVKDTAGKWIHELDIFIGERGWVKGDGYLKNGYPQRLKVLCVIEFFRGGFVPREKFILPEHEQYSDKDYRSILFNYNITDINAQRFNGVGNDLVYGDGLTATNIEIIGNVFDMSLIPEDIAVKFKGEFDYHNMYRPFEALYPS